MAKKIYLGNLNYITNEEMLKNTFSRFGEILSVNIIYDNDTSQSKGFAFIEFADDKSADKAILSFNGKELDGRKIRVSLAEQKSFNKKNRAENYRKKL